MGKAHKQERGYIRMLGWDGGRDPTSQAVGEGPLLPPQLDHGAVQQRGGSYNDSHGDQQLAPMSTW